MFSTDSKNPTHTFNLNIDNEGFFKYCFSFNTISRKLTYFQQKTYPWNEETKTLRNVFKNYINITVNVHEASSIKVTIKLGNQVLADSVYNVAQRTLINKSSPICTYDIQRFNQSGSTHLIEFEQRNLEAPPPVLLADLHTHFTGALSSKCLVDIVRNASTPVWYPIEHLLKNDILFSGILANEKIDLTAKTTQIEWGKFQNGLNIHPLRVSLFLEMEDVYNSRNPLLKNFDLFPYYLTEIAKDYQQNGIEYAELSLSDIVNQQWMDVANKLVPQLEQQYGVTLRFLVGIWRHSPLEYNEDLIRKIEAHLNNPLIKGADVMGQETNSTKDFASLLDILNEFKKRRPDFVIRVHAGESPCHPDNVKVALMHGATRIGHGIHGFNEEIAELAKRVGAIFELCISSNNALHSFTNPEELPLKRLIDLGVKVSLGTDGHGLYLTTHANEARLARRLGLSAGDLDNIVSTHREYINKMRLHDQVMLQDPQKAFQPAVFPIPKFPKDGWSLIEAEKIRKRKEVEGAISTIQNYGTNLPIEIVHPLTLNFEFKKFTPILFAGAVSVNWDPVSHEDKETIQRTIESFFDHLDPEKVVIVTGGTDFGLEKLVHDEIKRQADCKRMFKLLGGLATHLEVDVSTISKSLTHAVVFDYSWYDTAPHLLQWIKKAQGMTIYIGGGDVVKGMIYASKKLDIDFLVMDDVFGSSSAAAKLYPDHSFKMGKGALETQLIKNSKMQFTEICYHDHRRGRCYHRK